MNINKSKLKYKIDIIILNWKRPDNLIKKIIPHLLKSDFINKIYISHGRIDTFFKSKWKRVICLKHFKENESYGLFLRYYTAVKYAKTKFIFFQDDDILVPDETFYQLIKYQLQKKNAIHGIFGRYIDSETLYNIQKVYSEVPIVLTRILICNKKLMNIVLKEKSKIDLYVKKKSKPYWNGEDIFLNIISMHYNQNINYAYPLKYADIKDKENLGISDQKSHLKYRVELCKKLLKMYKIPNYKKIKIKLLYKFYTLYYTKFN